MLFLNIFKHISKLSLLNQKSRNHLFNCIFKKKIHVKLSFTTFKPKDYEVGKLESLVYHALMGPKLE